MSDKGDKNDDKKQSQSEIKNGVEKLIKIDKKHANFEFIDSLLNTKVKVRNINSSTSSSILGQNQPENTLRCFWRHINRYYFRRIDVNEVERLTYLDQLFSCKQDTELTSQKYANYMVYNAIKEVFDKEKYLNDQQQSPEVQKVLYKIIKANCNIQALVYECHFKDKANSKFLDSILKEKDQILPKKGNKKKGINELQTELQKLKAIEEKLLKKIEQAEDSVADSKQAKKKNGIHRKQSTQQIEEESDDSNNQNDNDNISTASSDEISYYAKHSQRTLEQELERLVKQLDDVNGANKQNHKRINQKVQTELKEGKLVYFENQNDSSSALANGKQPPQQSQQSTKQKKKSKKNNEYSTDHIDAGVVDNHPKFGGFQKELGKDPRPKMTEKELSDLHLDYLQSLIFTLEEKQVADSISKITNCRKENKKEFTYEVMFEDALNSQPAYIEEKTLLRFNEYREHSMLKKYNLPIKTLFSSTSHNFIQLTQYVTNRNQINPFKDQDILDLMKRNQHQHHDPTHHKILNLTRNFDICHHCRQIFDLGYLIKCNYRSSVMGMPQSSQSTNEQIFISQLVEYDSNQRRPFLNRKRNNYNSYIKKSNGELVCKRKFCVHCLKQNYDFKHDQSKIDWVCPFCSNYCHCIRCLRNEMINKLKGIYLLYGGDIQYLEQESLLNKYLRPLSEDDRKRKERDDIQHRTTNSSMIAFQVQKETYEKEVVEEKSLQLKLDEMTDVRLDMERVRLVISQVCRREKLKHLKLQEDQDIFDNKVSNFQRQQKKNAAKLAKAAQKELIEKTPKKQNTTKNVNATAKKQQKLKEVAELKKGRKKSKKEEVVSDEEMQEEEDEEVEESQQNENNESSQEEEEEQSVSARDSDSNETEQEVDEDEQEEDEEIEQEEDDEQENEESDVENSSQVEVNNSIDEEQDNSESEQVEEEEESSSNREEDSDQSVKEDDDEEIEEEEDDEEDNEVEQSDADSEQASENEEQESNDEEEEEDGDEEAEEEETEQQDESQEQETIDSDESTIEQNERSKSRKNSISQQKAKTAPKTPKKSVKSRQTSKKREKESKKGKAVKTNGKTKEVKVAISKKKKESNENKTKNSSHKEKENNINASKFIKRTKGSKSIGDLLNANIQINKEIKNLIRNQDPLILQLTSKREKALRSNMAASNDNNHSDHKHQNIPNGVSKHTHSKSNNHNKQNISKYEKVAKKKQKI